MRDRKRDYPVIARSSLSWGCRSHGDCFALRARNDPAVIARSAPGHPEPVSFPFDCVAIARLRANGPDSRRTWRLPRCARNPVAGDARNHSQRDCFGAMRLAMTTWFLATVFVACVGLAGCAAEPSQQDIAM